MEQDELDAMWHQKELEEEQLSGLLKVASERNLFQQQAMLDAIAYGNSLRTPKVVK